MWLMTHGKAHRSERKTKTAWKQSLLGNREIHKDDICHITFGLKWLFWYKPKCLSLSCSAITEGPGRDQIVYSGFAWQENNSSKEEFM